MKLIFVRLRYRYYSDIRIAEGGLGLKPYIGSIIFVNPFILNF